MVLRMAFGSRCLLRAVATAAFLVAALASRSAAAIPAFARAHGVPCSSCHIAIPRLNEFGDAFRKSGYHWPGKTAHAKDDALSLLGVGLFDGTLPAQLPLAVAANFSASVNAASDPEVPKVTIGVPSLRFLLGASFGEHVSIFGTTTIKDIPDELFLHLGRPFRRPELAVRVGLIEPNTTMFRRNDALLAPVLIGTSTVSGQTLLGGRLGGELNGIVARRLFYALGAVQNAGVTTPVDGYYTLAARVGGTNFLGEEPNVDLFAPASFLDKVSFTFDQWGYLGKVIDPDSRASLSHIRRLGADARLVLGDVRLQGGVMYGADRDLRRDLGNKSLTWAVELSYQATSWLMPMYMFQYQDASDRQKPTRLHDIGLVALVLENVRPMLRFSFSDDGVQNESAQLQILVGL
jgi:hypothetical protein